MGPYVMWSWRLEPLSGYAGAVGLITGLLIGWILVELAFIREFSFFHPTYLVPGLILIWLGRHGIRALRDLLTHPRCDDHLLA